MSYRLKGLRIMTAVAAAGSLTVLYFTNLERKQRMYKQTRCFKQAMHELVTHKGAIAYLGQPITDGYLKVVDKVQTDVSEYKVEVPVTGSKTSGKMYFWVRSKGPEAEAELDRIELKIDTVKGKLLVIK